MDGLQAAFHPIITMFSLVLALELSAAWGPEAGWREQRLGRQLKPNQFEQVQQDAAPPLLRVRSDASMSLWARALDADLERTPLLCWRWRIDAPLQSADLTRKQGDDYAARLYVAFVLPPESIGLAGRLQRALARRLFGDGVPDAAINYVWDNKHPVGHHAPNAYAEQTRMVVQRSGAAQAGAGCRSGATCALTPRAGCPPARASPRSRSPQTPTTPASARWLSLLSCACAARARTAEPAISRQPAPHSTTTHCRRSPCCGRTPLRSNNALSVTKP